MKIEISGSKLKLEIDCSTDAVDAAPLSRSQKTKLLATTSGPYPLIVDGRRLSLNLNLWIGVARRKGEPIEVETPAEAHSV